MDSTYGPLAGLAPPLMISSRTASGRKTEPVTTFGLFPRWGEGSLAENKFLRRRSPWQNFGKQLWNDESGQDIAEYAVMLAVILVIVVGTVRLIGSNANNVFSSVGSALQ